VVPIHLRRRHPQQGVLSSFLEVALVYVVYIQFQNKSLQTLNFLRARLASPASSSSPPAGSPAPPPQWAQIDRSRFTTSRPRVPIRIIQKHPRRTPPSDAFYVPSRWTRPRGHRTLNRARTHARDLFTRPRRPRAHSTRPSIAVRTRASDASDVGGSFFDVIRARDFWIHLARRRPRCPPKRS